MEKIVKDYLKKWKRSIDWIEVYYKNELDKLENDLRNYKAITYEEKSGGGGIDEGYRISVVGDDINALNAEKKEKQRIIDFCEEFVSLSTDKEIFTKMYRDKVGIRNVSNEYDISHIAIYKRIDREIERICKNV